MVGNTFANMITSGDIEAARLAIRSGDTDDLTQGQIISLAASANVAGMTRMLASEGALSVTDIEWTDELRESRCVAGELLVCGANPPKPSNPLEGAFFDALTDLRASALAAHIASGMAVIDPAAFSRAMAKMRGFDGCVSGRELLQVVSGCYTPA